MDKIHVPILYVKTTTTVHNKDMRSFPCVLFVLQAAGAQSRMEYGEKARVRTTDHVKSVPRSVRTTESASHGKSVRNMESASAERPRTFRERPRNNYVAQKMVGRSIGRSLKKLR